MKHILLISNANSPFVTNSVTWLKKENPELTIDIISYKEIKPHIRSYFRNSICIQDLPNYKKILEKIPLFKHFYRRKLYSEIIRKLDKYDIVHFHFFKVRTNFLIQQFKKIYNPKFIISIWGSDFYNNKLLKRAYFRRAYSLVDTLTFSSTTTKENFLKFIKKDDSKVSICRFGLNPLEKIENIKLSKEECKNHLKWDCNKIAITIGYNYSKIQQHKKIINQLCNSDFIKFKNKIQLIFPITYGSDPEEKFKIIAELKKIPFEVFYYENYLSNEEIAYIRKASDIMINLQKTDQFSGSMQEHLYAENIVITGSWLPYKEFIDLGVEFIQIDTISDLPEKLKFLVNNFSEFTKRNEKNPAIIKQISSWESNIKNWLAIYS